MEQQQLFLLDWAEKVFITNVTDWENKVKEGMQVLDRWWDMERANMIASLGARDEELFAAAVDEDDEDDEDEDDEDLEYHVTTPPEGVVINLDEMEEEETDVDEEAQRVDSFWRRKQIGREYWGVPGEDPALDAALDAFLPTTTGRIKPPSASAIVSQRIIQHLETVRTTTLKQLVNHVFEAAMIEATTNDEEEGGERYGYEKRKDTPLLFTRVDFWKQRALAMKQVHAFVETSTLVAKNLFDRVGASIATVAKHYEQYPVLGKVGRNMMRMITGVMRGARELIQERATKMRRQFYEDRRSLQGYWQYQRWNSNYGRGDVNYHHLENGYIAGEEEVSRDMRFRRDWDHQLKKYITANIISAMWCKDLSRSGWMLKQQQQLRQRPCCNCDNCDNNNNNNRRKRARDEGEDEEAATAARATNPTTILRANIRRRLNF